jgi:hypothetical protein
VKIQAAIDALKAATPGNPTGLVDATGFSHPQNCTGFTVSPGITVLLGPMWYTLPTASPSIVVNQGGHLYGMGANSPGATVLRAYTNFNKPIIKCVSTVGPASWWHNGEVRNLQLDGNKANNASGNALEVYLLGETSAVSRLNIHDAKQAGLYFAGSNSGTGQVFNVTTNSNGEAGIHVDDFKSGIEMCGVGGDHNPVTLKITNPNNGGGSIYITGFKSEKNTGGPAVEISGGSARVTLTLAGGNALNSGAADPVMVRILNTVGADPLVNISGMFTGNNYTTIIDDQKNGVQVTSDPVTYHGFLHYCAGKHVRFDKNGFTQVP